jgi:hypothetical protein
MNVFRHLAAAHHCAISKIAVIRLTHSYALYGKQSDVSAIKKWEVFMDEKKPVYFDLETVSLLRDALDDAWACLRPQERATMSRTQLAEGILALAAEGGRNPDRLIDAALMAASSLRHADAAA